MFNLLYDELPLSVKVDGNDVNIYTDYREFVEISERLLDSNDEQIINMCLDLIVNDDQKYNISRDEMILKEYMASIRVFMGGIKAFDKNGKAKKDKKKNRYVFSYTVDAPYIYGGFIECYGIDLIKIDYMHWWIFNVLIDTLNEKTQLKQRIAYRCIDVSKIKDKDEKARIMKIQKDIAIEQVYELDDEEIANAFG